MDALHVIDVNLRIWNWTAFAKKGEMLYVVPQPLYCCVIISATLVIYRSKPVLFWAQEASVTLIRIFEMFMKLHFENKKYTVVAKKIQTPITYVLKQGNEIGS